MLAILRRFNEFMKGFGSKPKISSDIITPLSTVQEDPRQLEALKRTRKMLEENQDIIMTRSLRPHSGNCEDPVTCEDKACWKFVPDKIVSKPYVVGGKANAKSAQADKETKVKRAGGVSTKTGNNKRKE